MSKMIVKVIKLPKVSDTDKCLHVPCRRAVLIPARDGMPAKAYVIDAPLLQEAPNPDPMYLDPLFD